VTTRGRLPPVELLRHFLPDDYARGLEDWAWTGATSLTPIGASPFGDVFLKGRDGISMLDTLEGHLVPAFADLDEMRRVLATPEGQDRFLTAGLALAAAERGLVPGTRQVYAYSTPPVLGGPVSVDNVEVMDFVVWLSLTGQIHDQVRNLPPGTRISGFTLDGRPPEKLSGRRGLFRRRSR